MSEAENLKPSLKEDLSNLKGPKWWYGLMPALSVAMTVEVMARLVSGPTLTRHSNEFAPLHFVVLLLLSGFSVAFWIVRNKYGYAIWWWKDGDTWRVTARGYPEKAKGLVIEVWVKARPSFTLRFGKKGWCLNQGGDWFENLFGERIRFDEASKDARMAEGITLEVSGLLHCARFHHPNSAWRIIPLDAGRVLRFVDRHEFGMEVCFSQLDGVDLGEILRSENCADYHKRMQGKASENKIVMGQAGEAIVKLGLPFPSESGHLLYRMGELKKAAEQVRDARDQAWSQLILCLMIFRVDVGSKGGRPKSKVAALIRVRDVLDHLHRNLPSDSPLRSQHNISGEELRKVDAEITTLDPELISPAGVLTEQGR